MHLDYRIIAKEVKEVIPQYNLKIIVAGVHVTTYRIDFKVILANGDIELHEYKGYETDLWKLKWKLTNALLHQIEPGAKLVLVHKLPINKRTRVYKSKNNDDYERAI